MAQLIQILDTGNVIMKNTFKILSYSKTRITLLMLFSFGSILLLTVLGGKISGEMGLSIGGCLGIFLSLVNTFITPRYIAKSELEIYCDTTSVEITCIKPSFGSKIDKIISIKYDDLKSYKFEATNYFSTFKLVLKDGTTHKFHRWYNDNNDQFDDFYAFFKKNIKINNHKNSSSETIKRQKSILENRLFLIVVAIILALMILTTIVLLFTRGIQNKSGFVFIFIFLSPVIWLVFQVINRLNKQQ